MPGCWKSSIIPSGSSTSIRPRQRRMV
jgi:hypothetical protein